MYEEVNPGLWRVRTENHQTDLISSWRERHTLAIQRLGTALFPRSDSGREREYLGKGLASSSVSVLNVELGGGEKEEKEENLYYVYKDLEPMPSL